MTERAFTRDREYLAQAFARLEIGDSIREMICGTHREVEFDITLHLTSGDLASFRGYRVQHDCNLGPFKGGLRFHPAVTRAQLRELAADMTWKTALNELPLGGAKGGVDCDPRRLDKHDLREITRRYVDKVGDLVGPELDIPAPDMGTDEETMAWFYDAYGLQRGDHPDVVTGKPLALHGTYGRQTATGDGVALISRLAAHRTGIDVDGARIAVQGFGNVASHAAQRLCEAGARIVAVSDSQAGCYDERGLDVTGLHNRRQQARDAGERMSVADAAMGGERITQAELLGLDVDVLIPAAIEYVITADNCDAVNANLVVEGANLPISGEAALALEAHGVAVVPDIMANAGGVVASYLEWVQNRQGMRWAADEVSQTLERRMKRSWERLCDAADRDGCSYRQAAFNIAVDAINTAICYRGI